VETFERARGGHEVEIEAEGVGSDLQVSADRNRIVQVLNNLLINAAKFSPPESSICIRVTRSDVYTTVSVEDQGRGIPPDKLPHLFRKFSQVHDQEARLEGTGLGLAICKGIVEAHGGRIWAQSAGDGLGSTFSFTLLLSPETTQPEQQLSASTGTPAAIARAQPKIMAVDDEVRFLRVVERVVTEAEYEIVVTSDPAQVPTLVRIEEPDLVLLDLRIPGSSGFELLAQIRQISSVPVIFLTGNNNEGDTVRALNAGADDYVTKPFTPSELLARIEAALRRRAPAKTSQREAFVLHDLRIDFDGRVISVSDNEIALTATEFKILEALAINAGRTLTHDQLLERVWGPEYIGETSLLRSLVRNLRRKLGEDTRQPRYIHTERDVGYRLG
jgi:DNA-binding response OmpR family regulator